MFKDFDISILSDKAMTKKELIGVLEQIYTKEKLLDMKREVIDLKEKTVGLLDKYSQEISELID